MTAKPSLKFTCVICGQDGLDDPSMKLHVLAVHALNDASCPFCKFSGVSADEMNIHVNSCHLDQLSPTKAPDITTASVGNHSPPQQSKLESQHPSKSGSVQTCKTNQTVKKETKMDSIYQCPMCAEFTSDSPEVLTLHVEQVHLKEDVGQPSVPAGGAASVSKPSNKGSAVSKNTNNDEEAQRSVFSQQKILNYSNYDFVSQERPSETENESLNTTKNSDSIEVRRESLNESMLGCPLCDLTLIDSKSMAEHLNMTHPEEASTSAAGEESLLRCPVCEEPAQDAASLQTHVDTHFQEEESLALITDEGQKAQEWERRQRYAAAFHEHKAPPTSQQSGAKKQKTISQSKSQSGGKRQTSMLDYCDKENQGAPAVTSVLVDDGTTSSKGIIEKLELYYRDKIGKNVKSVWLASPTDHYSGSYSDRGWGCGYRNLQMLLSCLVKEDAHRKVVFNGQTDMPSVGKIQRIIEEAWGKGFDPQGREQLNGKLVSTRKWIGATEIFTALASLKIRCQLVDFCRPTGPDGTHPSLFEWARDYFKAGGFRPPLYLQHQGHSRTIVGVEEGRNGVLTLLLFDPGTPRSQMQQFLRNLITPRLMQVVRRLPSGIKAQQYQVVAARGLLTDAEQQHLNTDDTSTDKLNKLGNVVAMHSLIQLQVCVLQVSSSEPDATDLQVGEIRQSSRTISAVVRISR